MTVLVATYMARIVGLDYKRCERVREREGREGVTHAALHAYHTHMNMSMSM